MSELPMMTAACKTYKTSVIFWLHVNANSVNVTVNANSVLTRTSITKLAIHKKNIGRHVGINAYKHIQRRNLPIMGAMFRKIFSLNHERMKFDHAKAPPSSLNVLVFSGPSNKVNLKHLALPPKTRNTH